MFFLKRENPFYYLFEITIDTYRKICYYKRVKKRKKTAGNTGRKKEVK
jgi:hypothetical protein